MNKCLIICILLFANLNQVLSQTEKTNEYFDPDFIRNEDFIYKKSIATPLLYNSLDIFAEPIVLLGSDQSLKLSFDDFANEYISYKYTFLHCEANWKTSDLVQADYLDGFYEDYIIDYKYSLNTMKPYIHYTLIFPTEYMKFKVSGNYMIKVFEENSGDVVLTMRFMVYEPKIGLTAVVKWSDNVDEKRTHQQVNFSINRNGYYLPRYEQDMKIFVKQNGRWDNIKTNLKPSVINGDVLTYDLPDQTSFTGDNEFRYFDIKNFKYNTDRVAQIIYDNSGYNVMLKPDTVKRNNRYLTWADINGKYYVGAEQVNDQDIEAEYCFLNFNVPFEYPLVHGSVYVMGQITRWQLLPEARMNYNYEQKKYEAKLFLKQGYYNYQYVFLENGTTKADASYTEGSYFETENDYTILVYAREPGIYFDKLIAYQKINSIDDAEGDQK